MYWELELIRAMSGLSRVQPCIMRHYTRGNMHSLKQSEPGEDQVQGERRGMAGVQAPTFQASTTHLTQSLTQSVVIDDNNDHAFAFPVWSLPQPVLNQPTNNDKSGAQFN